MILAKADEMGAEISHFYMIGDNPAGDIKGANAMNGHNGQWSSILVQSGLYHPDHFNQHNHPLEGLSKPTYEVKDMLAAI